MDYDLTPPGEFPAAPLGGSSYPAPPPIYRPQISPYMYAPPVVRRESGLGVLLAAILGFFGGAMLVGLIWFAVARAEPASSRNDPSYLLADKSATNIVLPE